MELVGVLDDSAHSNPHDSDHLVKMQGCRVGCFGPLHTSSRNLRTEDLVHYINIHINRIQIAICHE